MMAAKKKTTKTSLAQRVKSKQKKTKSKVKQIELSRPRASKQVAIKFAAGLKGAIKATRRVIMAQYRANPIDVTEAGLDRMYAEMAWWDETNIERLSFEAVNATDMRQSEAFYKSMQEAVGLNVGGYVNETGLDKLLKKAVEDNVEQITDLMEEDKARVRRILNKSLIAQRGKTLSLTQELLKGFNTDINQAKFIARDQTQRLNNSLNEFRQKGAGITKYKWSSSRDGSVRQTHKDNNGKIFSWDKPPVKTGNPGFDYNCRCVAIPVLEVPNI